MAKYAIHISDINTYNKCRLLWDIQSPLRQYLEPDRTPIHFVIGRAIHYALAKYYEWGAHPADTYTEYMRAVMIQEGIVVWEEEKESWDKAVALGSAMCENYLLWIASTERPDDEWDVIATEVHYEAPLVNALGKISNRVSLEGRWDQLLRHKPTKELWLREFKTSARYPDAEWLTFDDQSAGYCWAASKILNEPVVGVQYRFLLKKAPTVPPLVYNGARLSKAVNSNLSTTYEIYLQAIRDNGFNVSDYVDVLDALKGRGWNDYFVEIPVRKTLYELEHIGRKFWTLALEMTRANIAIVDEPAWMKCVYCVAKEVCIQRKTGGNWRQMLEPGNGWRKRLPEFDPGDQIAYEGATLSDGIRNS